MNLIKLFFLLVTLVIVSCGEDVTPVEQSIESKILYLGNGTEPKDLDPHTVTGVPESKILMALLEGLVIRNPDGTEPIPGVAKSWTISKDGMEYIFLFAMHFGQTAILSLLSTLFILGSEY